MGTWGRMEAWTRDVPAKTAVQKQVQRKTSSAEVSKDAAPEGLPPLEKLPPSGAKSVGPEDMSTGRQRQMQSRKHQLELCLCPKQKAGLRTCRGVLPLEDRAGNKVL